MATFPALQANTRSYTPARFASTAIQCLNGNEVNVRHTNSSTGSILRLTFTGITQSTKNSIIAHYSFHARFIPFDLDPITLLGSNISIPLNYQWIYVNAPTFDETPGVITANLELELISPFAS